MLEWAGGDMKECLGRVAELGITAVSAAPFTVARMFGDASRNQQLDDEDSMYDLSTITSVTVTGAPSALSTLKRAKEFLIRNGASKERLRVQRALGITEAGSLVAYSWTSDPPLEQIEGAEGLQGAYQGRLEPNFEAKIVEQSLDGEVDVTEAKRPGELWLKGPSVVREYWGNDQATREAFGNQDGWFRTGDIGFFDGDKLWIIDRIKDVLKTPDSIPPAYIEGVLESHPDIREAGVIGIDSPTEGLQRVRGYLVRRPGSTISETDICAWMERESAKTAHLTAGVEFLDELPRNKVRMSADMDENGGSADCKAGRQTIEERAAGKSKSNAR
ncbi:MAG: hypothetical protein Q9227_008006 [Pyrenula ochraceoflavens]